ncbi:hypothetical protein BBO99_00008731 [Phytophthora kernoviae]|uniref:Ubiquitin thioesterase OTU n=2 Tax=Phytophthora kernoviae TaxID=325452 RepID=A0A421GE80_9STRA|nr:hypothetical protein G195_010204 [Phytophthora kernoviae 00238/432]KAG2510630.1 hypothetical protein JM16_008482 [Phytophthora kernoviae]KAG2512974.1 hypothetical protein JM18_008492 [Phytophthora kernoviae]RLN38458.1 hypothetical protein BBI17_008740 [Phytophthora kernoviae]RLN74817.1 hypothetical protein BBO99_00008731 [Phytophthora kernoviae]
MPSSGCIEALGRGVRLELWKAKHENVVVLGLESELIQLGMTRIRDYENDGAKFTHDANGVLRSTLDLALTELPNDEAVVTTPRGYKAKGLLFEDDVKVCGISIAVKPEVQSGLSHVLRTSLPFDSKYGEILVQGLAKGGMKIAKAQLPDDIDDHEVLLLCPELASISQVDKVIHLLMQQGVEEEKITVVTLVTCPEAADSFCKAFGDARLVTASFDTRLDVNGHIVPGIGSFEERYLGAASAAVELADDPADLSGDENALKNKISKKLSSCTMPLNFKLAFADGSSMKLMGLPDDITLDGLQAQIFEKTSIAPQDQHVMTGFPPKMIEGSGESTLVSLGVRTGSVLVLKEAPQTGGAQPSRATSIFMRRVVPADNSCLFHSIGYALGKGRGGNGPMMRQLIKETILADPETYSEVFLGRPVYEYCAWIIDDKSWGGEIELSILSTYYKVEMVVFDVTSMSRLCYGEDQGFTQRMFLLYDGIHYDLVVESPSTTASERQDVTLFAINDFTKVERASEVAVEAHQVR